MFRGFSNPKNYNDNTSGVATLLEIMRGLDEDKKNSVAFIFFDNEEKGKKGSKAYFNDHKTDMEKKLLINFDCVGNGETVVFIAKEEAEKTEEYKILAECFTPNNGYTTEFYPMRGSESNSDYKNFPMGIGCMACKRTKRGMLYTPFIHTPKDIVAKNENIEYITDGIVRFLGEIKNEAD
jgi:Iap family predicted aminopeptidase